MATDIEAKIRMGKSNGELDIPKKSEISEVPKRILIAEDDPVSQRVLEATLQKEGYSVSVCNNGEEAWKKFQGENPPNFAILDWMMPQMDGVTVCSKLREEPRFESAYLILLTAKGSTDDIVTGLQAGANDYLTKPFKRAELMARVQVGMRFLGLQNDLADRVKELEQALKQVKLLKGLLPMCCICKKIRDDTDYWQDVETYLSDHSEATFTHGICPPCAKEHYDSDITS